MLVSIIKKSSTPVESKISLANRTERENERKTVCETANRCVFYRKPAQLEGLEVDQYVWGILNTLNTAEIDEVTIDSAAAWKAAKPNNLAGIKSEEENEYKRTTSKAMSPGSMNMPTMNNWEMNQAMSPYLPPDMSSIVSGSMMNNINHRNTSGGTYEINSATSTSGSNDYAGSAGALSHLSESVNTLDTLNAIEKSINEQVCSPRYLYWSARYHKTFREHPRCVQVTSNVLTLSTAYI